MKRLIQVVFVCLGFARFSFADIRMDEVNDWLCFPINPACLENMEAKDGYSKEEIIDALLTFAAQTDLDTKYGSNGFRRSLALASLKEIGSTNDLPRISPLVLDDSDAVQHAAIAAYVEISSKTDLNRTFEFADYVLQLPHGTKDEYFRRLYVLTVLGWLVESPTTNPEIRSRILEYFHRNHNRDWACAARIDSILARTDSGYLIGEERRNLVASWATNSLPNREYFVGVQRKFFPEDVPPDGEVPPPAQTNGQETVRELVEPMPNGSVADGTIESVDSTAGTESLRASNRKSWFALLGLLAILGLVAVLRGKPFPGKPN